MVVSFLHVHSVAFSGLQQCIQRISALIQIYRWLGSNPPYPGEQCRGDTDCCHGCWLQCHRINFMHFFIVVSKFVIECRFHYVYNYFLSFTSLALASKSINSDVHSSRKRRNDSSQRCLRERRICIRGRLLEFGLTNICTIIRGPKHHNKRKRIQQLRNLHFEVHCGHEF